MHFCEVCVCVYESRGNGNHSTGHDGQVPKFGAIKNKLLLKTYPKRFRCKWNAHVLVCIWRKKYRVVLFVYRCGIERGVLCNIGIGLL